MTDKISRERRSENMRHIPSKGTKPEIYVRRFLHCLGFRYRLHQRNLPGKPDLVFPRFRKVIFVHGCFWHLHKGCREGRIPGSRQSYWEPKLKKNVERDRKHVAALGILGWKVLIVWECEIESAAMEKKLIRFMQD